MEKANKKMKTPNYHAMIFAVLLIIMWFMFMNSETTKYVDIVTRRDQVADSVRSGNCDILAVQEEYEECARDMEELEEESWLGSALANFDESTSGKIRNYCIVYGARMLMAYLVIFISWQLVLQVKIIWCKIEHYRTSKNIS